MTLRTLFFTGVALLAGASQASASLIFDFSEVGGNVELVVSGSFDLNATTAGGLGANNNDVIGPVTGTVIVGDPEGLNDIYTAPAWTPFGSGGLANISFDTGDRIGLFSNRYLGLPVGYISGDPLSASGTILGATFATLGMTPGSYVTTLTNGNFTDTVVVNVNATPVPEPATLLLLGTGLGAVAARRRLKKRA